MNGMLIRGIALVGVACAASASVGSEKVDALWKYMKDNEKVDASTPEGDKIADEIEARQNALNTEERAEFEQRMQAAMMEQMQKAMKQLVEIPVDTPAAKVDFFEDDTNSVDTVFGVPFGTKVDKKVVLPSCDAGPLTPMINETKLKIPKSVKWFTAVSGQPNARNKRIESLTFKAEIPEKMPKDELERGLAQLKQLMLAKFGPNCMKERHECGDFFVYINSPDEKPEGDMSLVMAQVLNKKAGQKLPRMVSLHIENKRIDKLDPEIPPPKEGDGFADDLKIPEGLKLAEPEGNNDGGRPAKEYEDDGLFAKALADPKDHKPALKKLNSICLPLVKGRRDLVVSYFEQNPLWQKNTNGRPDAYVRVLWAGDQYCKIVMPTRRPIKYDILAREGCRNAEAGWYAACVELTDEFSKLAALKDESGIAGILPKPKKCVVEKSDFRLVNGMQGGIYGYSATIDVEEDGEVYLRAYEVTKGTRLSAQRMKQRTLQKVTKGKHTIGDGKEFTIYEGDWEKYYAARIEIWFVPASGGRPRKLRERLFRVQGWMF